MIRTDVIVLGAGIVGVSAALHLQRRGRSVVLVDRRGPGEETSHGNAGIIQREGVVPYAFPRELGLIARYALNLQPEARLDWSALPWIAPWLFQYWRASTPARVAQTARAMRPLVERCIVEHEALMGEAGILGMVRRTGYMRVYRSAEKLEAALAKEQAERETYGVNFEALDPARIAALEPHLRAGIVGGVLLPDPVSVADPGGGGEGLRAICSRHAAGGFCRAMRARCGRRGGGWEVAAGGDVVRAGAAVVALGPWSDDVLRPLGYRFPLGVKRGYHRHFAGVGNATLNRPVLDAEAGYVLAPMSAGIRLTTSVEFARRDAPPSPVQLDRAVAAAREIFPLGETVDRDTWLGRRPCLPDMLPVIGAAPRHAGPVARLRAPSPGFHAGAGGGTPAGGGDDGRGAVHRSRALPRGAVRLSASDLRSAGSRAAGSGAATCTRTEAAVPHAAVVEARLDQALALHLPGEQPDKRRRGQAQRSAGVHGLMARRLPAEAVAPGRQRAGERQRRRLVHAAGDRACQAVGRRCAERGQLQRRSRSGRRPVAAANTTSPSSGVCTG